MFQIKRIHFIGICGVAMSALALALKRAGYEVTGSDVGIYPPISTYLKENGINYYVGWHPEKMGKPDLVVIGNVASSNNPEWLYVQEHKLNYKSYPEVIKEFFIKENSIVCAGTYGKTTSSALLTWILKENNFDPSYMFGGISLNGIPSASLGDNSPSAHANSLRTTYSVVEGDEYKSARWDNGPKFAHYSPTHLLLTAVVWDHADVYPTEELYFDAFQKLVDNIPEGGLIVVNENVSHITYPISRKITYGKSKNNDYQYSNFTQTKDGIEFTITTKDTDYGLRVTGYGDYNAENITGCFAMAHQLGIEPENIIKAIASFKNIKRRLEKRYSNGVTVFDDIAHSPKKAESVLASLRRVYSETEPSESEESLSKTHKNASINTDFTPKEKGSLPAVGVVGITPRIICVFEPNGGNRQSESIPGYDNAFINADEVIIPHLTTIKQDPTKPQVMDGQQLTDVIAKTHNNVKYIDDDNILINHLTNKPHAGDVIVFCGSHGFRGIIEELITQFRASEATRNPF